MRRGGACPETGRAAAGDERRGRSTPSASPAPRFPGQPSWEFSVRSGNSEPTHTEAGLPSRSRDCGEEPLPELPCQVLNTCYCQEQPQVCRRRQAARRHGRFSALSESPFQPPADPGLPGSITHAHESVVCNLWAPIYHLLEIEKRSQSSPGKSCSLHLQL